MPGQPHRDPPSDARPPFAYGLPVSHWLLYRVVWLLLSPIFALVFRVRPRGHRELPRVGPYLLLSNHSALLDPFWVAWPLWRPMAFMASAHTLKMPVLGAVFKALGAFPKHKFVKDRDSMVTLAERYGHGIPVLIYPEGERTFDGTPLPVVSGIGRLIKRLDARVVYARMHSAHLADPRWARRWRFIPIDIEYDGPYRYPDTMTAEEITADVAARIETAPTRDRSAVSLGWRLAEGLPDFLWACPSCQAEEALRVDPGDRDRVACLRCGAAWRVDLDGQLNGERDAPTATVAELYRRVLDARGDPPVQDQARFEADGVALESPRVALFDQRAGRDAPPLMTGRLVLTAERVALFPEGDGPPLWASNLDALLAVSLEVGSSLQLRTSETVLRVAPEGESVVKWGHFLRAWRAHRNGT